MKNSCLRYNITYLLFILFISMKMVGLHFLSHINEEGHGVPCTICDDAIINNLTPTLTTDSQYFTIKNYDLVVQRGVTENYNSSISSIITKDKPFTRPPPSL